MTTRTLAFIFARGGSKGLPKKNILPIAGLPLLAHGIRIAKGLAEVERVYVSTDCQEIADVARQYDADVIDRPIDLASDTAPEWLAWQHAIAVARQSTGEFDRFLSLPPTAPLRNTEDVRKCLDALQGSTDAVITMTSSQRSPWFNMVTANHRNQVCLVAGDGAIRRRQDAPQCFDMTTLAYVARPAFVLRASGIWEGNVVGVEVPRERSIDIDTALDLQIARHLMEQHQSPGYY